MRRISTKNRIIALALCFLMVMSLFPSSAFANTDAETSVVGRTATFAGDSVNLYSDPANWQYSMVAASELPQSVVITEVSGDYYKITGADGTWPEDYAGLNYVKSTELKLDEIATPDPDETTQTTESSEPSTSESEGSCDCCEACTNAEDCACVCENDCAFCDPEVSCGCCEDCTDDETCTCQCEECTFCEEEDTTDTTDPSEGDDSYVDTTLHSESGVSISGSLPVGAAPAASAMESNIYDIKILNADGNEWQPIDEGKTVTIQIPVTGVADGGYVDVYHFIDYAPDIDGDEEIISIDGIDDAARAILQPAINAYGDSQHIAVEVTQKAMVSGGKVSVLTDSFSVYIVNGQGNFELAEEEGYVKFSNWTGAGDVYTAYASPGTTFTLYTQFVGFKDNPYSLVQPYPEGVVLENGTLTEDGFIFDYEIKTAKVTLNGVSVGDRITIKYDRVGENDLTLIIEIVEEVTISYDANGVTDAKVPEAHGAVVDGKTGIAVKNIVSVPDGYTFEGWNTSRGGDGTTYTAAELKAGTAVINPTKDTTLYAMWKKNTYTIEYDLNGGSGTFADQTKTYGVDLPLRSGEPTRTGYKFLGWCTTKDGSTTIYKPGDTFAANADATLHAIWGVNVYLSIDMGGTITYYNDKYEETPDNNSATLDNPYSNDEIIEGSYANCKLGFTPAENYVITGVKINGTLLTTGFTDSSYTYEIGSNGFTADTKIEVTTALKNYTITYNSNLPDDVTSTTSFPTNGTKTYNEVYTIAGGAAITGYDFTGWNTTSNGTGTSYSAGATYSENADLTLYAQWTPQYKYVVTFNANAPENAEVTGMPAPVETDWISDDTYTVNVTDPTCTGYTFVGWAETEDAETGTKSFMIDGNRAAIASRTLYAVWHVKTHSISYEVSGKDGVVVPSATTGVAFGSLIVNHLTNQVMNIAGYNWSGWMLDGEAIKYQTMPDDNITVTGEYTAIEYKITYDLDGGALGVGVTNPASYTIEDTVTLPTPTRANYEFKGWKVSEAEGNWTLGEILSANSNVTGKYGNVTLTAQWDAVKYTITYNYNDGSTLSTTQEYTIEQAIQLVNPSRTGYTFKGWKVEKTDGNWSSEDLYSEQIDAESVNGNVTLQAQWEIKMVTLTIESSGAEQSIFDLSGETLDGDDVSLTVAINGTGKKTIIVPAGTYEVIPQNDWSWRCADVAALDDITISEDSETLTFSFTQNNPYWLDGCDYKTN